MTTFQAGWFDLVALLCVLLANLLWWRVIYLVNRGSHPADQISYFFHHPAGMLKTCKRYRELDPRGVHLMGIGFLLLVTLVWLVF